MPGPSTEACVWVKPGGGGGGGGGDGGTEPDIMLSPRTGGSDGERKEGTTMWAWCDTSTTVDVASYLCKVGHRRGTIHVDRARNPGKTFSHSQAHSTFASRFKILRPEL